MKDKQTELLKKRLRGYRMLCLEIKAQTEHLKWFTDEVYNPLSDQKLTGMPHASGTSDQTADMVMRIDQQMSDMIQNMERDIIELQNQQEELLRLIKHNSLNNAERTILYNRYVMGRYWEHMEAYTHYSKEQSIRIHNAALSKLKKHDTK